MEWKAVPFYEGKYEASTGGQVRNAITGKYVMPYQINPEDDHLTVTLTHNGDSRAIGLHRVIATTFVPNYGMQTVVHHKDFNPKNNRPDNLEWVSTQYNIALGNGKHNTYTINVYRHGSELIKRYQTRTEFVNELKVSGDTVTVWNNVVPYMSQEGERTYGISEVTFNWLLSESYTRAMEERRAKANSQNGAKSAGKGKVQVWINSLNEAELAKVTEDAQAMSQRKFKEAYGKTQVTVKKALGL